MLYSVRVPRQPLAVSSFTSLRTTYRRTLPDSALTAFLQGLVRLFSTQWETRNTRTGIGPRGAVPGDSS